MTFEMYNMHLPREHLARPPRLKLTCWHGYAFPSRRYNCHDCTELERYLAIAFRLKVPTTCAVYRGEDYKENAIVLLVEQVGTTYMVP